MAKISKNNMDLKAKIKSGHIYIRHVTYGHINMIYSCINSWKSPNIPTMGFIVFHLEECIADPCQATMTARRSIFLCMLINNTVYSKSTATDASIIAIIYFYLLHVNCLFGISWRVKSFSLCLKKSFCRT